jgi:hypothetical protein
MEQEIIHPKKKILVPLIIILSIFFAILTISTLVDVFNKIKEGKYIGQESEFKNSISISETGEVYAKPDLAMVSFSVVNEAKTIAQAMSYNTEKMNNVIETMKEQGIEEKDLKTIYFNINPRYEYTDEYYRNRVLVGYEITQQLQVKIRNIEKVGDIIEKATSAGANDMGNLQFTIDDQDGLKKQAREQAIEKSKVKAEELSSKLGVKLGKVISFNENSYTPYYDTQNYLSKEEAVGMGGASPDVQTGENKITVSVNILYEIY